MWGEDFHIRGHDLEVSLQMPILPRNKLIPTRAKDSKAFSGWDGNPFVLHLHRYDLPFALSTQPRGPVYLGQAGTAHGLMVEVGEVAT